MPLFKKKKSELEKPEGEDVTEGGEKRPGTSGTENLLVTTRRQASQRLQSAQKAERTYKTKKRAKTSRENFKASRDHFKTSASHLKDGIITLFKALKAIPYVFSQTSEERKRNKAQAQRKKLEEQLAKTNEEAGTEAAPAEEPKE